MEPLVESKCLILAWLVPVCYSPSSEWWDTSSVGRKFTCRVSHHQLDAQARSGVTGFPSIT